MNNIDIINYADNIYYDRMFVIATTPNGSPVKLEHDDKNIPQGVKNFIAYICMADYHNSTAICEIDNFADWYDEDGNIKPEHIDEYNEELDNVRSMMIDEGLENMEQDDMDWLLYVLNYGDVVDPKTVKIEDTLKKNGFETETYHLHDGLQCYGLRSWEDTVEDGPGETRTVIHMISYGPSEYRGDLELCYSRKYQGDPWELYTSEKVDIELITQEYLNNYEIYSD